MAKFGEARQLHHIVKIVEKKWLGERTFELLLEKPADFIFVAGQKILCGIHEEQREYSLASGPNDEHLHLCIRLISDGSMSVKLSNLNVGDALAVSDAYGFLVHRPGKSVFIATGTGIAPFAGFYRAGVGNALVLHGVKTVDELYYRELFITGGSLYVPCLSAETEEKIQEYDGFSGRVTTYLDTQLKKGEYNFYLCGNGKMIGDAMQIIDKKFPQSRIFTELFF